MNIILFYQHIGRELYSIQKLEKNLSNRGYGVYVYSIDFEFDIAIRKAKKIKIDVVVSPWMYHEANYQDFVSFIKHNPNIKIINLHSEQIYSEFSKQILLPTRGVASECVYHFCWGNNFRKLLLESGIKDSLIRVTGNMRNDELFAPKYTRERMAEEYQLDINKKWIIFAENRNFIKNNKLVFNKEYLCKGITVEQLKNRANFVKQTLEITIDELNNLNNNFFEEYELIYRAHPGFQGDMGIKNNSVHEISDLSIYEWLNEATACVVWNSTVAFEAELFNVPVFIYTPIEIPWEYNTVGLNAYERITHIESIMSYDMESVKDKQSKIKNYVDYYGVVDGHAVDRVEKAIIDVYKADDSYKAIITKNKPNFKGFMAMLLTRCIVRLRLLDIIKFPRSSYLHKNDIPNYLKRGKYMK